MTDPHPWSLYIGDLEEFQLPHEESRKLEKPAAANGSEALKFRPSGDEALIKLYPVFSSALASDQDPHSQQDLRPGLQSIFYNQ